MFMDKNGVVIGVGDKIVSHDKYSANYQAAKLPATVIDVFSDHIVVQKRDGSIDNWTQFSRMVVQKAVTSSYATGQGTAPVATGSLGDLRAGGSLLGHLIDSIVKQGDGFVVTLVPPTPTKIGLDVFDQETKDILADLDDVLAKGDDNAKRLIDALAMLRGPDSACDGAVKSRNSAVVRETLFPKTAQVIRASGNSNANIPWGLPTSLKTFDTSVASQAGSHYADHAVRAKAALNL